jgi:integrase
MARQAKWPPVPTRHRTGQARVNVGGVDHYLGTYGSPEAAEALRELVEKAGREGRGKAGPAARPSPRSLTVEEAVARWAAEELPKQDAREQSHFRRALSVLVRLMGAVPAAELDVLKLRAVRAAMASGGWLTPAEREGRFEKRAGDARGGRWRSKAGPWNRRVCNRQTTRVRTVWRWCEERAMVPRGSWAHLCSLKAIPKGSNEARPERRRKVRKSAEVIRVAVAVSRGPARLMLLLQLWTGMRSGEVRRMLWSEVDTSGDVWVYRPPEHKNAWRGHEKAVTIGPRGQAVLRLARKKFSSGNLVFPCRVRGRGRITGPYKASAYGWTVRRAAERCGVGDFRPYDVRHAFRVRVSRRYGLEAARAAMGHTSVETTADYASEVDVETAAEVARKAG